MNGTPPLHLPSSPRSRYEPEEGDTFVLVRDLGPQHVSRVFEARDLITGVGTVGYLADVSVWPLLGEPGKTCALVQFRDNPRGYFAALDGVLNMKPEGWTAPGLAPAP